jgi:hypothetical protein
MEGHGLTLEELGTVRAICEASEKGGLNWPLMIQLFPAESEEEEAWKVRMLKALKALGKLHAAEHDASSYPPPQHRACSGEVFLCRLGP